MINKITKILFFDWKWTTASTKAPFGNLLKNSHISWEVNDSEDNSVADPHLFKIKERNYLLVERISRIFNKGRIDLYMESSSKEKIFHYGDRLLDKKYHLSFPTLYEVSENEYLLMCESIETKTVKGWTLDKDLNILNETEIIRKPLIDPVLYKIDDIYFLFGSLRIKDQFYNFTIHKSKDLVSWEEMNSENVSICQGSERNAGALISWEGKIYRPSQILEPKYGSGISINEVVNISQDSYTEKKINEIVPENIAGDKYNGLHTLSILDDTIYIDLRYSTINLFAIVCKILRKLRKGLYIIN